MLRDGRVLVAGGSALEPAGSAVGGQTIRITASAEVFDPETRDLEAVPAMATPSFEHTATLLGDGRVLMVGGLGPSGEG